MIRDRLGLLWGALLLVSPNCFAQYIWEPYEDNPVISFDFDQTSFYTYRPAVIKRDSVYHLWYGKQTGLEFTAPRSVAYATSPDGIEWSLKELFALEPEGSLGSFDQVYATDPTVVDEGDTLKMWYTGAGQLAQGIGLAWSLDGSTWAKVQGSGSGGSIFDAAMDGDNVTAVVRPTVISREGVFHMWYEKVVTSDRKSRIGYARSSDGRNWTPVPGAGLARSVLDLGGGSNFDADQLWWPWVLYNEEKELFEMWYQGIDAIQFGGVPRLGCAHSEDGITWMKVPGDGDAGACRNTLAQPGVILDDGLYKMWYALTTTQARGNDVIFYATSDPTTTDANEELPGLTASVSVYPNPSRGAVTIRFGAEQAGPASIEITDLLGRLVTRKPVATTAVPMTEVSWDGRDEAGRELVSGIYFLHVRGGEGRPLAFGSVWLTR